MFLYVFCARIFCLPSSFSVKTSRETFVLSSFYCAYENRDVYPGRVDVSINVVRNASYVQSTRGFKSREPPFTEHRAPDLMFIFELTVKVFDINRDVGPTRLRGPRSNTSENVELNDVRPE